MATLTETRLASETARDGVDTRNKENVVELCEDSLPVDEITCLGEPAVEEGNSCEECGSEGGCVFTNHLGESFNFCKSCYTDAREGQDVDY